MPLKRVGETIVRKMMTTYRLVESGRSDGSTIALHDGARVRTWSPALYLLSSAAGH